MLTQELHTGRRLLVRLDLLLVVGDEAEVREQRDEEQQTGRGQDDVDVHYASGTST